MAIKFNRRKYDNETLLNLYKQILKPRIIEERMLLMLREGKITKWFSGIGQEAISVGVANALEKDEYLLPMHRNLGVFTSRGIPFCRLFAQFEGKMSGFTQGRDRSFHFGTQDYHIVGMISHLGPQMGVADGIALANKLSENNKVCAVFTGDGGTSEGEFHEAINTAAVWDLPVIFIIENNGYGLSTPSSQQFKCKAFVDKAIGYGIEAEQIDGNNILDVYHKISEIAEDIRKKPRPILVECLTFRMRGHEEASGTKYVPKELMEEWAKKDPVQNYENFLLAEKIITEAEIERLKEDFKNEIKTDIDKAYKEEKIIPDTKKELKDVYAPFDFKEATPKSDKKEMRFVDAVQDGLKEAMKKHDKLVLMGQDIADYGGVFKVTEGFMEIFGEARVRNTPLCESAILGTGLGLSINGYKAMVEMQFADFVSMGMTQIINNFAKIYYRWKQNADVVVRMPTGAGVAAGPFHSQSDEAFFFHTPGLKIAYPAFPADAKGLLITAFEDPNPVMYFEHKALYRSTRGDVPQGYYNLPFGKAALVNEGKDFSIITYGMGVHWALNYVKENPNFSADILDLRTLAPLDWESVYTSVKKTGRVLVLNEDTLTGSIASEIAAQVTEKCFQNLDAPVMRLGSLDTPVPFTADLEQNFLASARLAEKVNELLEY